MDKVPYKKRATKRLGGTTQAEANLVAALVADQPREMTNQQVSSLAKVLRRSKDTTKALIEDARADFASKAPRYVEIHAQATEQALANGDAKSLEVAAKASQWAIAAMSQDGIRVVEKAEAGPTGMRIMVGVSMGGVRDQPAEVLMPVITVEKE